MLIKGSGCFSAVTHALLNVNKASSSSLALRYALPFGYGKTASRARIAGITSSSSVSEIALEASTSPLIIPIVAKANISTKKGYQQFYIKRLLHRQRQTTSIFLKSQHTCPESLRHILLKNLQS